MDWGGFIWTLMPFGVKSGPLTYQKAVTKTFKDYLDNFMKIFLDDFIVYSDMESHLQKLKLCFQKCIEYGISLNINKCAFMVFLGIILGFIISKKKKLPNLNKIKAIVNMPPPKNPQQIQVFNGMAQFYGCFIKNFTTIMANVTKLTKNIKNFLWIKECQKAWKLIKQKYIEALILISPNWQVEFHVHIDASLFTMGATVAQNVTWKKYQPIMYVSRLLNRVKHDYNTIKEQALIMVFVLHKFRHYLLGNKFVFYVNHMALVYLVNKSQVSRRII